MDNIAVCDFCGVEDGQKRDYANGFWCVERVRYVKRLRCYECETCWLRKRNSKPEHMQQADNGNDDMFN